MEFAKCSYFFVKFRHFFWILGASGTGVARGGPESPGRMRRTVCLGWEDGEGGEDGREDRWEEGCEDGQDD